MLQLTNYSNISFKNSASKKMKDLSEFSVDKAVLVHMTDYLPKDGVILSTKNSTVDKQGCRKSRDTVHFAFNHAVTPNSIGFNWDNKPIGIIAPFNKVLKTTPKEDLIGGEPKDFYIKGKVKLPEGTVIVRQSKHIPAGKLRVINAETIDSMKHSKGIKIIETSDNVKDVTNNTIEKMGYTRLDTLYSEETGIPIDTGNKPLPYLSGGKLGKLIKADDAINQAWSKMANNVGFNIYRNHQTSPYGRSEFLIESVDILARTNNKWESEIKTFNIFSQKDDIIPINYKTQLTNVIDNITTNLQPNKKLSYDINRFKENIQQSKTPKEALKLLAKEQKIKPMNESFGRITPNSTQEDIYTTIHSIVNLFAFSN